MDVNQRAPFAELEAPDSSPDGSCETKSDLSLRGLVMLARFHGVSADEAQLRHQAGRGGQPFDDISLLQAAKRLGLKARVIDQPVERLDRIALPAMALRAEGEPFLVAKVQGGKALIHDISTGRPAVLPMDQLADRYEGRLFVATSRASLRAELRKFDFTWFIPAIIKYRKLILEALLVSLILQLFALVTPLFFQVVMDKVLVHQAMTTLNVITFGLIVVTVFNVALTGLRSFVFSHTTSRIDVELGAQLFRHLLALPMAWFEVRRVGDTTARIRELDNIRNFLTGQTLTSVLDLLFTTVFIAVMAFYSGWLTLIVVASLPLYALWSALISPMLRRRCATCRLCRRGISSFQSGQCWPTGCPIAAARSQHRHPLLRCQARYRRTSLGWPAHRI